MDAAQLFEIWAPADSVWSRWVKPALFAAPGLPETAPPPPEVRESPRLQAWTDPATAFVIDMPGSRAVEMGLVLAHVGYRPVPLFNAVHHAAAVIDVAPIQQRLTSGVAELQAAGHIPSAAPPAFLLDSNRSNPSAPPAPGRFDNRWVVFPQDFPSANFLLAHGVRRVVLLQEKRLGDQPNPDLAHVLRRWQEAGIELYLQDSAGDEAPRPMDVKLPSRFRSLFYRALALAGLRRNSAGGFGSIIPQPSSSSGIG